MEARPTNSVAKSDGFEIRDALSSVSFSFILFHSVSMFQFILISDDLMTHDSCPWFPEG